MPRSSFSDFASRSVIFICATAALEDARRKTELLCYNLFSDLCEDDLKQHENKVLLLS
jgi:hypothetical protein